MSFHQLGDLCNLSLLIGSVVLSLYNGTILSKGSISSKTVCFSFNAYLFIGFCISAMVKNLAPSIFPFVAIAIVLSVPFGFHWIRKGVLRKFAEIQHQNEEGVAK